jgi:hypothetical protein
MSLVVSVLSSLLLPFCALSLGESVPLNIADDRKPLGEPAPQVSNLALAIVILVVITIHTAFVCLPQPGGTLLAGPY